MKSGRAGRGEKVEEEERTQNSYSLHGGDRARATETARLLGQHKSVGKRERGGLDHQGMSRGIAASAPGCVNRHHSQKKASFFGKMGLSLYSQFRLYGLRIYGLFGHMVRFLLVPFVNGY